MKCTSCNKECFDNKYPEIVFKDDNNFICEDCSIDFEEIDGNIYKRQ